VTPLLTVCIPTYNRKGHIARLLRRLEDEIGDRTDIVVHVGDNASKDGTRDVLRRAAVRYPWLRTHRHPENLGAMGNLKWLAEHSTDARYLWCIGDDDLILPGGLAKVAALLEEEAPRWLFLPHVWLDDQARPIAAGSPAPGRTERYAGAGALWRAYHHWLTFLSASVLEQEAYRAAMRDVDSANMYGPLLWFFKAGLEGPCVVAPEAWVGGGQDVTWSERRPAIVTLDFTSLYDDGLAAGLTQEEFGATLDGLYAGAPWAPVFWKQQEPERLAAVVARFPESRALRAILWSITCETPWPAGLPVLDAAARAVRDDVTAQTLVREGEERFAAGDHQTAATRFLDAVDRMPTLGQAWSDLGVVLHAMDNPEAARMLDTALFVAPDDVDALLNRASVRLGSGSPELGAADARRVLELDPGNAVAAELLDSVAL
jgi:tetratricopeptide (TPR) repeat protein